MERAIYTLVSKQCICADSRLPIWINNEHGNRAKQVFKQMICKIMNEQNFAPEYVIEVIPKLMNTLVVSVMEGSKHGKCNGFDIFSFSSFN